MRLPRLPKSMIIMGGGYVAAEFAHVFSAFGTAVTVINRSDLMLRKEDPDVATRFTELMGRQVDLGWVPGSSASNGPRARAYAPTSPAAPGRRSR
jgi:pyruvate/2-oxoglutarate dehydrogenase complex dihydrolipoamide dehydrogenase (E3) component